MLVEEPGPASKRRRGQAESQRFDAVYSWLLQQVLHLRQVGLEELEGLAHRLRRGHVDSGLFEQVDAVVGGAGREETAIPLHGGLAFTKDLTGEGR